MRKKSKYGQKAYAINYTQQEDHLRKTVQKKQSSGWSPKRFKKYPRFTIFLNNCKFLLKIIDLVSKNEDVISLNPQFLNFLMSPEKVDTASKEFTEALNLLASQNLRKFDPFDKVVLSNKGIDNPILTSFRTLAKTNNSLSDTFKIIHNKFLPDDKGKKNPFFNIKQSEGKSKSYLLNPPPDLSGMEESILEMREEYLQENRGNFEQAQEDNFHELPINNSHEFYNPQIYRNSKTTTAKSGQRMKLYYS